MRTKLITGLSLLLLLVLTSGCAATSEPAATPQDVNTLSNVDRYLAIVNAHAKNNGTEVHWVNIPDEGDLARYELAVSEDVSGGAKH